MNNIVKIKMGSDLNTPMGVKILGKSLTVSVISFERYSKTPLPIIIIGPSGHNVPLIRRITAQADR